VLHRAQSAKGIAQLLGHGPVNSVSLVGPIHGDGADRAIDFELHKPHALSPFVLTLMLVKLSIFLHHGQIM
jgi:hypothetical protein